MAIAFGKNYKCIEYTALWFFPMEDTYRLDGGNMSPSVVE
jgi:hypothetical protein